MSASLSLSEPVPWSTPHDFAQLFSPSCQSPCEPIARACIAWGWGSPVVTQRSFVARGAVVLERCEPFYKASTRDQQRRVPVPRPGQQGVRPGTPLNHTRLAGRARVESASTAMAASYFNSPAPVDQVTMFRTLHISLSAAARPSHCGQAPRSITHSLGTGA